MRKPGRPPLAIVDAPTLSPPEPPRNLGAAGRNLWNSVQNEFLISDCGGVELLMQACAAIDRVAALAARIDADGEVVATKAGPKAHPALRDELNGRAFVVRTLQKLGLTDQPIKAMGRPSRGWSG